MSLFLHCAQIYPACFKRVKRLVFGEETPRPAWLAEMRRPFVLFQAPSGRRDDRAPAGQVKAKLNYKNIMPDSAFRLSKNIGSE